MDQKDPQFKLRIPREIRDRLQISALRERRSMNSQIVKMLEQALSSENEKAETAATASA
ncbi:Arc family DNA-binding protein [Devosia sp.]|uniref:Arc family DNA-binding protein n=1 Tax=Devosia sp. TaxID=1871048 RepID=UPI0032675E9C